MKHGILFFLNMGRITTAARIAIPVLIYLTFFQVRPFGVAYFSCFVLLILSVILAMIPAPSDRTARRALENFRYEHKQELMSRCGFVNDEELLLLYGYAEDTNMWMKRALGREIVYPSPVAIGFAMHLDRGRLLIGRKTLLKKLPAEYFFWKDQALSDMEATVTVEAENEEVAKLMLTHPSRPDSFVLYVKNDFRVRDFVNSLEKSKKN